MIERHQNASKVLQKGLNDLGLQLHIKNEANRLPTITAVKLPREIDWKKVAEIAANEYAAFFFIGTSQNCY